MKLKDCNYLINKGFKQYLKYHSSNPNGSSYIKEYLTGSIEYIVIITHKQSNNYILSFHIKGNNSVFIKNGKLSLIKKLLSLLFND